MKEWYNSLTAGQRMFVQAAAYLAVGVLSAVVNQSIGARRGYRKGYAEGIGPLKKSELDLAERMGYEIGWTEGVWAYHPEVYSSGLRAGAEMSERMHRGALEIVRQVQAPASAPVRETELA